MFNLSALVSKYVTQIEADGLSDVQMINLLRNAEAHEVLEDSDRERLVGAIETKLRENFPKSAKKLFGPKDTEAREALQRIWLRTVADLDVSRNRHKNGVKTGGHMIKGDRHVDVYISYRNESAETVHLSIIQETPADPFRASLARYFVGGEVLSVATAPGEEVETLSDGFRTALLSLTS